MSGTDGAWVVVAPRAALAELRPLVRAHERLRPVRVVALADGETPRWSRLEETAAGADGLLLVGDRRRAPRSVLPGPFLRDPGGRLVPAGWAPYGTAGLARFARAAARVVARADGGVGPVALLGQWEERYLRLVERMEARLAPVADRVRTHRWTAERITRGDLVRGLRLGVGAAIYFGHGRPKGWAGYHGLRAHHLVDGPGEPIGAVLSVTCLTANRWRTGLAFSEAITLGGAAGGAVGAVAPVEHLENMRWMLGLADALAAGERLLGPALRRAAPEDRPAGEPYRILGDPLVPLAGAANAATRSARVFAPAADAFA